MIEACSHEHGARPGIHGAQLAAALGAAEARCAAAQERLTPPRRRVLELLLGAEAPLKAYDLIAAYSDVGEPAKPPTVYRALDFLIEQGLVHRVESLNAFIGCTEPGHPRQQEIFICRSCGTAQEINDPGLGQRIHEDARALGFRVERQTIEAVGLCSACAA